MTLGSRLLRRLTRTPSMQRRAISSSPLLTAAGLAILLVAGGCAPLPGQRSPGSQAAPGEPANGSDATFPTDAQGTSGDHASGSAPSNPAAARYVLPGTIQSSPAIGSIVVTNPLAPRTVDLTQRPDDIWDRVRTGFAIPNIDTTLVAEQQAWYLAHPDYLRRAVDRSSRYLFHVVEELNKRGMPTELALLPFVESAYNPMAYSRAHASGMWQFIPGTGKTYNLKQDWWRDERRDVIASTDAALTYLQTIYEMHGDWHLALASYNWGEGSVKRAIERNQAAGQPTDYLSLSMPDETRNYVPKLQALKNIIANPKAFGVTLPRIDNVAYFVAITRDRDIDVVTAAKLANLSVDDFRALNPSFNRPVIRASSTTPLLVPADRADDFKSGLASRAPLATWQAHTVRKRETVERIAAQYGMTSAALRQVNGLPARGQVRPGQALLVQKSGEGDANLRFASFVPPTDIGLFGTSPSSSTVQVRRGDTAASVAKRYGMSLAALRSLNHLKGNQVAVGQHLQVQQRPRDDVAESPRMLKVKAGTSQAAGVETRTGRVASTGRASLQASRHIALDGRASRQPAARATMPLSHRGVVVARKPAATKTSGKTAARR